MSKHRAAGRVAQLVIASILLFGCGTSSNSADPEEVDAVATKYTSTEGNPLGVPLTQDQAACRAQVILESDLSNNALETFKQTGQLEPATAKDADVLHVIADLIATDCL